MIRGVPTRSTSLPQLLARNAGCMRLPTWPPWALPVARIDRKQRLQLTHAATAANTTL
jgi:hypothetical protein